MEAIPTICPLRTHTKFNCDDEVAGITKERCKLFEDSQYLGCPSFSRWFWYKVYSEQKVNVRKGDL